MQNQWPESLDEAFQSVFVIGKDKDGEQWEVKPEKDASDHTLTLLEITFLAYCDSLMPDERYKNRALVSFPVDRKEIAKLDDIRIIRRKRNRSVGSKLLTFVEEFVVRYFGIVCMYGDIISNDRARFSRLRRFYTRNHWTWELFSDDDARRRKDPSLSGRVEKRLNSFQNDT